MKRFLFSLEKLLETKLALEEGAQRRLADGLRCLQIAREELSRMSALIAAEAVKIEELAGKQTDKQELLRLVRYRQALQQAAQKQGQLVLKYESAVNQLRGQLHKIMAERKSLDNLKEIEHKRWQLEQKRADQKDMDEISMQRHLRRTVEMAVI